MKRACYIGAFTILGILLQFIAHALLESWYIGLLLEDYETYGLGFSWQQWEFAHAVLTVIFLAAGAASGFALGRYWWRVRDER